MQNKALKACPGDLGHSLEIKYSYPSALGAVFASSLSRVVLILQSPSQMTVSQE